MGLIATIMLLSRISPSEHFTLLTICAFMVGLFAATQDAAIEAYRIEIMPKHYLGYVMMISTLGFRLGMLTSGAFAVYLAIYVPWSEVYSYMSMAVGVGVFATLIGPRELYTNTRQIVGFVEKIKDFWENSIVFAKSHNFALIFAFIFFYKMGDSAVNAVSMQFLQNTGFDKIEISGINRTFGILMMIFGSFCGGIFIQKTSVQYALKACSVALIVGSLLYMRQAMLGYDPMFLYVSTGGHNFIVGLSQTALITYMSSLCNPALGNTATQYAIVASVGSMSRIIIGALACRIADHVSWDVLFMIISCACVPTLFLQSWRRKEMSPA
jgi:PAT family beta-lactamase induction signal transducer AmpG